MITTRLSRWILQKLGWVITGAEEVKNHQYAILAVAPHTSNWDFLLGMLIRSATGIRTRFLGKKSLFRPPFGWIFRWLGGYPVDRSRHNNMVDATIDAFKKHDTFKVTLAPEGTRKRVDRFKTGFYHIAKGGGFPIFLVAFDFGKKEVRFSKPMHPGDNFEEDLKKIYQYFAGVKGKNPKDGFFWPPMDDNFNN